MSGPVLKAERRVVAEQAAQWLCELPAAGPDQRAIFIQWLKVSPVHVEEFLLASATLRSFRSETPASSSDVERWISDALTAARPTNVVELSSSDPAGDILNKRPTKRRSQAPRWASIAAGIALVGAGLAWMVMRPDANLYATAVGEQRSVLLADGTLVYLNAQSRLHVRYSTDVRDVQLERGEAIFHVYHDATRPFRVHAGEAVVQAVGTQFDVYRTGAGALVSVLEGKVSVFNTALAQSSATNRADPAASAGATKLVAGEQVDIIPTGKIVRRTSPNVAQVVAWRERRLVFRDATLEDIAAEFSRYSPRKIRLEDEAVRKRRITGTFDADDPASLVQFLESLNDLNVRSDSDGFVIAAR